MFGFFFGSWSSMEIYIIALYAMLFQLFPASRASWLFAFFLTTPFYLTFFWLLYNVPLPSDRHGYGQLVLTILILPPIVGNIARATGLFFQSKGLTRFKALICEFSIILSFIAIVYSGALNAIYKPFELPQIQNQTAPIKPKPLEKIE